VACLYGKQHSRPVLGKITTAITYRAGILSADQTRPGQRVFVDHFVCSTQGRKFKGYGIKSTSGKVIQSRDHPMQVAVFSWMPLQEECTLNFKVTSTQKKLLVLLMLSKHKREMMVL